MNLSTLIRHWILRLCDGVPSEKYNAMLNRKNKELKESVHEPVKLVRTETLMSGWHEGSAEAELAMRKIERGLGVDIQQYIWFRLHEAPQGVMYLIGELHVLNEDSK